MIAAVPKKARVERRPVHDRGEGFVVMGRRRGSLDPGEPGEEERIPSLLCVLKVSVGGRAGEEKGLMGQGYCRFMVVGGGWATTSER